MPRARTLHSPHTRSTPISPFAMIPATLWPFALDARVTHTPPWTTHTCLRVVFTLRATNLCLMSSPVSLRFR